jgi:hypothetical protein
VGRDIDIWALDHCINLQASDPLDDPATCCTSRTSLQGLNIIGSYY